MPRIARVVAPLAALAALVATAAPAGATPHTLRTSGPIEALSADGPRVAIDVSARFTRGCNRIVVWNVLTDRVTPLTGSTGPTCGADGTSTGSGVSQLALAGTRAAWVVNRGGNTESDDTLVTAAIGGPQRVLARASRHGQVDGSQLTGSWLGGVVGDGAFLGVSSWTTAGSTSITHSALSRVRSSALSRIAPDAGVAQAADGGRVATLTPSGDVAAYTQAGRKLADVTPGATPVAVGLRGTRIVVLTKVHTLEIYDALSGTLVHRWPLRGAGSPMVDVHYGIAVYSVYRTLYAVRLATGKTAAIATAPRRIDHLQIEGPGVVYSFSTPQHGTVRFLPFAAVSARI